MNTKDLVVGDALFALFKGEPGTGKSIAAHSFPQPSYTFDLDRKMSSVKSFYPDIDFEFDQFDDLIQLNRKLEEFRIRCPYRTIVFDSVTSLSQLAMRCMIKYRAPSPSSKTVRAGVPGSEIEDYGGETNEINLVLDHLKAINISLRVNIVVTAHVIVVEHQSVGGKITNTSRSLVTAGRKIAAVIPTQFDEAYHFDVAVQGGSMSMSDSSGDKPDYIVYTRHVGDDWARTALKIPTSFSWTDRNFYEILRKRIDGDISL